MESYFFEFTVFFYEIEVCTSRVFNLSMGAASVAVRVFSN